MFDRIEATAPGKMCLLGEYAVLDGAPAVVVAVNRRAQVRVVHNAGRDLLIAPEVHDRMLSFTRGDDGTVHWPMVDDYTASRLSLIARVIERFAPQAPVEIRSGTADFFEEGIKLGFGSSAAVTVAAASALAREPLSLVTLVELHREIQDGRGSGFDVAASRLGGVTVYRALPTPKGEKIDMPEGLLLRCVWTGHAASTTGFVRGLDALGPRREAMRELMAVAEEVVAGLSAAPSSWVQAVRDYAAALQRFAVATTLPIFSGGHADVLRLAAAHGVAYKPSGAGGGDIGVAISDDPQAMRGFVGALAATKMRTIAARPDPDGLQLTAD